MMIDKRTAQTAKHRNPSKSPSRDGERVIYRCPTGSPLRLISMMTFACILGSATLAGAAMVSSIPGDAIAAGKFEERLWVAGTVASLFVALFIATWLYERRIVSGLALLPGDSVLRVKSATLLGWRERDIALEDLSVNEYHRGDRRGENAMTAPWLWVAVRGRNSFVLPLNGPAEDVSEVVRLLGGLPGNKTAGLGGSPRAEPRPWQP